jgi:hypothetical protein
MSRVGRARDTDRLLTVSLGNDLFLVSIHELGHALGLAHSTNPSSVMFATYQHHNTRHFKMPIDDIMGIEAIYGPKTSTTAQTTTTTATSTSTTQSIQTTDYQIRPMIDICSLTIRGLVKTAHAIILFSFDAFASMTQEMDAMSNSTILWWPLAARWPRLNSLDAVFFDTSSSHFLFLSQNRLHCYQNASKSPPIFISNLNEIHHEAINCVTLTRLDTEWFLLGCRDNRNWTIADNFFYFKIGSQGVTQIKKLVPSESQSIHGQIGDLLHISASWERECASNDSVVHCLAFVREDRYLVANPRARDNGFFVHVFFSCPLLPLLWKHYRIHISILSTTIISSLTILIIGLCRYRRRRESYWGKTHSKAFQTSTSYYDFVASERSSKFPQRL